MRLISHDDVWTSIAEAAQASSRKVAAVSYVSSDVYLKFEEGDLLVTDASEESIVAGHTSARVLLRAINRGARVFSRERLHAKVMLFDTTLVVGSANISINSRSNLVESVFLTNHHDMVDAAMNLVSRLQIEGHEINSANLDHLITLETRRRRTSSAPSEIGEAHIIFFKEVLEGDIKKYNRESASSGTGGGARDLRVSPANQFFPLLRQMISEPTTQPGVTHGRILSQLNDGSFDNTDVELWRPTDTRSSELRFARVYDVRGWAVTRRAYENARRSGQSLFFVLEMDVFGTVFAKVLNSTQLSAGYPLLMQHVADLGARRKARQAVVGAVDVIRNIRVP